MASSLATARCLARDSTRLGSTRSRATAHALPPRVARAVRSRRRFASRSRRAARPTTASTSWSLDGVGCAGARSGDGPFIGYNRPRLGRGAHVHAARNCPLKPIDISSLCSLHGTFKMLDAVFEQENDHLYVRCAVPEDDAAGSPDVPWASSWWAQKLDPRVRAFTVRFFLFFVAVQRAWLAATHWPVVAAAAAAAEKKTVSPAPAPAPAADGTLDERPRSPFESSAFEPVEREPARPVLTVDGAPIPSSPRRVEVRPGAVLQLGGRVFEAHRDVRAHA